ncbi:MAG: hypothetical protein NTY86_10355 [Deltaproteobacteria bacterium]|nr:hypothetical protein [Deltaproteobacteria bacterium]
MIKEDLITAIDKAKTTFKTMMDNEPGLKELKGYLVLSSPHGQFQITDDPLEILHILKEFPAMISESEFRDKGIELIETIQGFEVELKNAARGNTKAEIQKKIENASHLLNANLKKIEFKGETFVEIRFKRPIVDLIFKMQKDPLVSQVHTPQSQASIRIVLGTLIELAQRVENLGVSKDKSKQL